MTGFELTTADDIGQPEMKYWPGGRYRIDLVYETSPIHPALGWNHLHWRWQLLNQDEVEVLQLEATSLFDLAIKPPA